MSDTVDLYSYDDYRRYLSDWMEAKAAAGLSMRWFARRAGFRAHNIMQLVIQGKRNLTPDSIRKFTAGLGLDDGQSRYFEDLVLMNQARTARDRAHFYQRLIRHPQRKEARPMEAAQLSFFGHWLAPVIFEMIGFADFRPEAGWIAAQFEPPLDVDEVAEVMAGLLESGLVATSTDGAWRQVEPQIGSGDDVRSVHLYAYHERALEKAADALHAVPGEKRHFHVLTAAMPEGVLPRLVELAEKFEADVWRTIEEYDGPVDQVAQISLQIFPTLRPRGVGPLRPHNAKGKGRGR